jgi:hypothetical protein
MLRSSTSHSGTKSLTSFVQKSAKRLSTVVEPSAAQATAATSLTSRAAMSLAMLVFISTYFDSRSATCLCTSLRSLRRRVFPGLKSTWFSSSTSHSRHNAVTTLLERLTVSCISTFNNYSHAFASSSSVTCFGSTTLPSASIKIFSAIFDKERACVE